MKTEFEGKINAHRAETKGKIMFEGFDKQKAFLGDSSVGEQELKALGDSEAKAAEQEARMRAIEARLAAEAMVASRENMTQDEADRLFESLGVK